VAVNPVTDVAYLAKLGQNGGQNRVVEFGGAGRTLLVGDPRELVVSRDGEYVYLTQLTQGGANPGSVAVIDANTFAVVNTIPEHRR
jgi:DNA-binding beta-propeller fold protein YncE